MTEGPQTAENAPSRNTRVPSLRAVVVAARSFVAVERDRGRGTARACTVSAHRRLVSPWPAAILSLFFSLSLSLFIHPRLPRLLQPVHPHERASLLGPRARRSSGRGGNNASAASASRIRLLWGQVVGRESAESPLAGFAGCGHITIAATISFLPLSLSLSRFLPVPRSRTVVSVATTSLYLSLSLSPPIYISARSLYPFLSRVRVAPITIAVALSLAPAVPLSARGFREETTGGRDTRRAYGTELYQAGASPTYYNGQPS